MTASAAPLAAAGLPDLAPLLTDHPHVLLFATVSGAHLYGFPSRDSDVDLRGVHLLPVSALLGLDRPAETHARTWDHDGLESDLVTHDLAKFARLLLRPNGYVLEQLLSPLVVHSSPTHAELADLAPGLLTRHHARHYRGFARTQLRLFERTGQLKPLLYTFRVLLTGIHLMRAQEVLAHLPSLTQAVGEAPGYLPDLVAAKETAEHGLLSQADGAPGAERLAADVAALHAVLDRAELETALPERPTVRAQVEELVVGARVALLPP
ncbi:nucleotidyltransferase domain-containing protein [Streptomyces sp. CA-250714]|uniref:nucleotidyltransferase domain-containing protein n=1 Tax=Streptomyces sp. CA-250714 TaxID=3240060 RepID=UPI003D9335E9